MSVENVFRVAVFTFGLILSGCGPGDGSSEGDVEAVAEVASLEGSNWQLVQMTVPGGFVFTPEDPADYVLNFRSENRLTGSSDCNRITGNWQQQGAALTFDPFSTARALCPPPSLHNYLSLYLRDVISHRISGEHLFLTTNTEGVELEFQARE
ncbi:MAG: META domain-containing protein [Gammaproteobacteria bacterium]|nr:META domain-containing protein [Pseudomonadales bacterium]